MFASPLRWFRRIAIAEAVTWALLLIGMVFKYSGVTEIGVRVFGMVHGIVFIAYCLTTILVAVDQRWTKGRALLGLVSAVPPFMTVWFDRFAEKRGALGQSWRLRGESADKPTERVASWLLRNPVQGLIAGVVAVAALTVVALLVGPPASS